MAICDVFHAVDRDFTFVDKLDGVGDFNVTPTPFGSHPNSFADEIP